MSNQSPYENFNYGFFLRGISFHSFLFLRGTHNSQLPQELRGVIKELRKLQRVTRSVSFVFLLLFEAIFEDLISEYAKMFEERRNEVPEWFHENLFFCWIFKNIKNSLSNKSKVSLNLIIALGYNIFIFKKLFFWDNFLFSEKFCDKQKVFFVRI